MIKKIICANCKAEIPDDTAVCSYCGATVTKKPPKLCRKCGAELGDTQKFCHACGEPFRAEPTECPNCKTPIIKGAAFCGECGMRFNFDPDENLIIAPVSEPCEEAPCEPPRVFPDAIPDTVKLVRDVEEES